jgi:GNAT superfamily N-acetyltransferase
MTQQTILYSLHSLTESDISSWADFCASCFSYKPNPPGAAYFSNHFNFDPRRDAKLLCVIKATKGPEESQLYDNDQDEHARIVASTRVFLRTISLGDGKTVEAGGIGEVCTDASHRKKGLAKQLLMNRITLMRQMKITCSLLHASPALMNVYERSAEYESVNTYWKVLNFARDMMIDQGCIQIMSGGMAIRLASFPNDTCQLQKIHKEYSEDRFAGCIIRSMDYWNEYIRNEIGDSLYVLHTKESKIIAWMSIRKRSNKRFQLRDFGCCRDTCTETSVTISHAFTLLAKKAFQPYGCNDDLGQNLEFTIPLVVYNDLGSGETSRDSRNFLDWVASVSEECDCGWMYKSLESFYDKGGTCDDESGDGVDMPGIVNEMIVPHLIWPADSF